MPQPIYMPQQTPNPTAQMFNQSFNATLMRILEQKEREKEFKRKLEAQKLIDDGLQKREAIRQGYYKVDRSLMVTPEKAATTTKSAEGEKVNKTKQPGMLTKAAPGQIQIADDIYQRDYDPKLVNENLVPDTPANREARPGATPLEIGGYNYLYFKPATKSKPSFSNILNRQTGIVEKVENSYAAEHPEIYGEEYNQFKSRTRNVTDPYEVSKKRAEGRYAAETKNPSSQIKKFSSKLNTFLKSKAVTEGKWTLEPEEYEKLKQVGVSKIVVQQAVEQGLNRKDIFQTEDGAFVTVKDGNMRIIYKDGVWYPF